MITIYIKEWNNEDILTIKKPKWLNKIEKYIIKKGNIILKEKLEENKKIYFIPDCNQKNTVEKIQKSLQKEETTTQKVQVVLEAKLRTMKENLNQYKIVEGTSILKKYIQEILHYILREIPLEMQDVFVLSNQYSQENVSFIQGLAQKVKSMNIITKEIQKYEMLENLLVQKGMIACVANNKKKSLKKAQLIINLDFSAEELRRYTIGRNAIIINISLEKIVNLKFFDGIIIQDVEWNIEERDWSKKWQLFQSFKRVQIYETIQDTISFKKHSIQGVYGNNGKIDEKELRNAQKILTNGKN